jgi:hypothetical protein
MKISKSFFIATGIICICCICLFFFRHIPVSHPWKGYEIMYIPKDVSEKQVLDVLAAAGCRNVIASSVQEIPATTVYCPIKKNEENNEKSYLEKRNAFFSDKHNQYRLFYISDTYIKNAQKAMEILISEYHINAGIDSSESFPWMAITICFLLYILLLFNAENHFVYGFSGIFPLLFILSFPFYAIAAAVCLLLYDYYLVQKVWQRAGAVHCLVKNFFILFFAAIPLFIVFITSFTAGIILIMIPAASFSAVFLYHAFEKDHVFSPVFIRPAGFISIFNKKSIHFLLACAIGVCMLIVCSLFGAHLSSAVSVRGVSLPVPIRYTVSTGEEAFPSLTDYIVWNWNTITYPYRSLNSIDKVHRIPENGETVILPRYKETEDGISESNEIVFRYDSSFRKAVMKNIDALPYPAIEKVLKKQGNSVCIGYLITDRKAYDPKSLLLLLAAGFVPLIVFVYNIIIRKKNNDIYF